MSTMGREHRSKTPQEEATKIEEDLETKADDEEEAELCVTTATTHETFLEIYRTPARHVSIFMTLIILLKIAHNC